MDPKALFNISYGLYVVGSKLDGKYAGCVVDAFIQSTSEPTPTVILCSILKNQTNAAIKQTGEFTVSTVFTVGAECLNGVEFKVNTGDLSTGGAIFLQIIETAVEPY